VLSNYKWAEHHRKQLWNGTTFVRKKLNCKSMAAELEEAHHCSELITPQPAFRTTSTKQIRAIISSTSSEKIRRCAASNHPKPKPKKSKATRNHKSVVVDVVFYAEGNSRVPVANMRHGYFVPLRHAEETVKEKESKSKQVAYCFDICTGRAKRKGYVERGSSRRSTEELRKPERR
jgi:hypothetical protein